MASTENTASIVGRGTNDGARLFREWFEGLTNIAGRGEQAAYVFVMGSLAELLRVFDLPLVFPEINSLQTAVRRVAHEYLNQAEDYGYSPDICGYVKADVGRSAARRASIRWDRCRSRRSPCHQRLQHLHQVGGDLGAHVRDPGLHPRRARDSGRRSADVARRPRLRERPRATWRRRCAELIARLREANGQAASTSIGCARSLATPTR